MDPSESSSAATIAPTSTFIPPTSLCPGYKQVGEFNPDDGYYSDDEEEDVSYVTLDLGNIEPTLIPSSSTYRLIGLDTPTPFLQLSGTILKGRHDSLLGTELLFTEGQDLDKSKRSVTFTGSTSQRISFREVQLVPKGSSGSAPSSPLGGKFRDKRNSKGKAPEGDDEPDSPVAREEDPQMVDRVTGKMAPKARASRGKKGKIKVGSDDEAQEDGVAEKRGGKKGKSRVKVKVKERAKSIGKEKEKEVFAENGDGDGTVAGADDMNVDEG